MSLESSEVKSLEEIHGVNSAKGDCAIISRHTAGFQFNQLRTDFWNFRWQEVMRLSRNLWNSSLEHWEKSSEFGLLAKRPGVPVQDHSLMLIHCHIVFKLTRCWLITPSIYKKPHCRHGAGTGEFLSQECYATPQTSLLTSPLTPHTHT